MSAHSATAIANEFLRLQGSEPALTHMQLQKLVYIAHGWNLAINGEPLVADDVEAWDNGPVFRELWEHLKGQGKSFITSPISPDDADPFSIFRKEKSAPYVARLSESERNIIKHVWDRYGSYGAFKLSAMTHQPNTPWTKTYYKNGRSAVIDPALIKDHYVALSQAARAS